MDFHTNVEGGVPASAPSLANLHSATGRTASPGMAQSPCATCTVRHLCLPGDLDDKSRRPLEALTIGRRRMRKGQKIFREGDGFQFIYAVRMGTVKTTVALHDGHEQVTSFHLPGDLVGFDGVADGSHPTTATALDNAEVCAIPYIQLMEACGDVKPLRYRVAQLMALQLVRDFRSLKLVAGRGSEQRVAGFLLQMSGWMKDRGYSAREFQLRMSRADIGSYLGTALETVSRTLSAFARRGFITVRHRRIELLQPQELLMHVDKGE